MARFFASVLFASLVTLASAGPSRAQVSGTVLDDDSGLPLEGAIVTVQATDMRASTDATGAYAIAGVPAGTVRLVGARQGHYNASAEAIAPATDVEIRLTTVPAEDDPAHVFQTPTDCQACHNTQVIEWGESPMAHAGVNTWVHDIYDGSGTPNGDGGFVYTRDSVHRAANPESECASCHQPLSWIASYPSALAPRDAGTREVDEGISCVVCHQIANIDLSQPNAPGIFEGVVTLTRPTDVLQPIMYGLLGDVDFVRPGRMQAAYNPQLSAEICAACHQDANDPDGDHDFEEASSVISEPTYLEWLASDYADPSSASFATCIDCHMPTNEATRACSESLDYDRVAGSLRSHQIEGTSAAFLEGAISLAVETEVVGGELVVDVDITNDRTGHHVPTGVTIRNMVLLVEPELADRTPLIHTGSQVVHELGGVGDPAEGYYAGLPGKLYAKLNHGADGPGSGVTFFTDATGITEDNRIAANATDSTRYTFGLPPGPETDVTVRVRVIYRRTWRFLADAKRWTTDGHGAPLEDIQAPHFGHLMVETTRVVPRSEFGDDAGADAGLDGGVDGGVVPPAEGCGCRAGGAHTAGPIAILFAMAFVALMRRRR